MATDHLSHPTQSRGGVFLTNEVSLLSAAIWDTTQTTFNQLSVTMSKTVDNKIFIIPNGRFLLV